MSNLYKNLLALLLLCMSLIFVILVGGISVSFVWALLGVIFIFIFLQQKQYRQNILTISIVGFLIGWRGLDITPSFIIYPTEFFIWFGFLVYLMDRIIKRGSKNQSGPVFWEGALAFLALVGVFTSLYIGRSLMPVLASFKSFIIFIPMLILFRNWIHEKREITFYARTLVYVGAIISVLGLLERYVPAISLLFSKYMPAPIATRYNFEFGSAINLAAFSSWGTPVVSILLVLFAGLAAFIPRLEIPWQKTIAWLAFPVLFLGIISTGYRSAWLGLLVVTVLAVFFNRERVFSSLVLVVPGIIILFSSAYIDRFKTLLLVSNSKDPTIITRSSALQRGIDAIQTHPLIGMGWNSPTAFNDWINVGIAMGLAGLLVLVVWYGLLLYKLFLYARVNKSGENKLLYMAFFAALAGYSIAMVGGAMSQVFPIMTGFWFVFCLAWRLVEISEQEKQVDGKTVRALTNVQ